MKKEGRERERKKERERESTDESADSLEYCVYWHWLLAIKKNSCKKTTKDCRRDEEDLDLNLEEKVYRKS